jgi:hydrogenase nickel incorporation protein HypA/HybF
MKGLLRKIGTISAELGNKKIVSIKVKLGALSHISASHFREHFEDAVRGTALAGTTLLVEELTDNSAPDAQDIVLESVEVEE